jgi:thiol-disulfide isomerase/thioredoxin
MKKYSFILGIMVSVVLTSSYWLLTSNSQSSPQSYLGKQEKKQELTLLNINYVPTSPLRAIPTSKFTEVNGSTKTEKTIADYAGKPVILHFWATWCGACVAEMPELDTFAQNFEKDVHVIAITTDPKDGESVREYYESNGIKNLSIIVDNKGTLARQMGIAALPTTVFVNTGGKEIGRIIGPVNWIGEPGQLLNAHLKK